jgi:DnaJ family protein B protein 4
VIGMISTMKTDISLFESLVGWTRMIPTIEGKYIEFSVTQPTGPNWTQTYPGLGMPDFKDEKTRGNLIVSVKIKYPETLSVLQQEAVRSAFR